MSSGEGAGAGTGKGRVKGKGKGTPPATGEILEQGEQGEQGTNGGGVTGDPWDVRGEATAAPAVPETVEEIEADIESVRRQMTDVADELQRRGHRVAEVSRLWAWRLLPIAGGLAVLAAAGLGYRYWRSRRRLGGADRLLASLLWMVCTIFS